MMLPTNETPDVGEALKLSTCHNAEAILDYKTKAGTAGYNGTWYRCRECNQICAILSTHPKSTNEKRVE